MAKQENLKGNGITEGVIWKQLLLYFFPILLGTFFQQMYNTVDAVVVGQFVGTEALAAVGGTAGTLINLLVGFFVGLTSGATVIIAQFWGSGDIRGVSKTVHTAVALCLACGAFLTVVGIALSRWALSLMSTPDDVIELSATYMRIYFAGTIPSLIYNIGSSILRAVGDSKRPLYFLIISCICNIILDLAFVVALKLGVAGVGIATILSQLISAVLVMATLMRSETAIRFVPRQLGFSGKLLKDIVRIGLPAGMQSVLYSISNAILQSTVNSFGTTVIAAYTAYGKIDGFFWMVIGAFGVFMMPITGKISDALVKKIGSEVKGRKIMLIIGPACGAIGVALCLTKSLPLCVVAMFFLATYWGIEPGGCAGYAGSVFGGAGLGRTWGLATLIVMGIGPSFGTFMGAWFKDNFGSYVPAFIFCLCAYLISMVIAMTLPLKTKIDAKIEAEMAAQQ